MNRVRKVQRIAQVIECSGVIGSNAGHYLYPCNRVGKYHRRNDLAVVKIPVNIGLALVGVVIGINKR